MSNFKIKLSLFINYFLFAILLNSVGTVILQVQHHFGATESSASILEACKDLSIAISSFFIAGYIGRIGYKSGMLLALAFVAIACLGMPFLNSFWAIKLLFVVTGVSFALIKVSVFVMIGLVTNDESEHISLMNFLESFFSVGVFAGYFIFSAFVNDNDLQSAAGWLNVYYVLASLSVLAFALLYTTPIDESTVKDKSATNSAVAGFEDMFRLVMVPLVLVFVASAFIYVLIEQSIMSWLPTFNSKVLHLPDALSIQMASILAISFATGRFMTGVVIKRVSWIVLLVGCIVSAAVLVLLTLPLVNGIVPHEIANWSDVPLVAFVFPLIGFLIAPIYPAINSIILSSLPPKQHGVMAGLIIIFSALGGTTGSMITGRMFQAFGGQTAFYCSIIPMGLLIGCLLYFRRLQGKHVIEPTEGEGHLLGSDG